MNKIAFLLLTFAISATGGAAASEMSIEGTNNSIEVSSALLLNGTKVANDGLNYGGSYYDWGQGRNGWGYCYEWTNFGEVLNGGQAQSNYFCEQYNPSRFDWGTGRDGYGYCYQWTPYNIAMNEGSAQSNIFCEQVNPSYYSWGRGMDGYTYCYQYTPYGRAMNGGAAQNPYFCR